MSEDRDRRYSDEEELGELEELADRLGLRLGKVVRSGSDANLVGLQSEHVLFSRRLDSRTLFVHDVRYGIGREAGAETRADEHLEACRRIFRELRIPLTEIRHEQVLTERTQAAHVDRDRQVVHKEEIQDGRRLAALSRQVDGVPVWDSTMVLGLTARGGIGFLQLHWPELHGHVIHEARRLAHKLERDWRAPEQPGADVEVVEAGVIHSPAVAFCMDVYPAIRVIYRPRDPRLGQKVMLHFDRHRKTLPVPRQADLPYEPSLERSAKPEEAT